MRDAFKSGKVSSDLSKLLTKCMGHTLMSSDDREVLGDLCEEVGLNNLASIIRAGGRQS